MENMEEFAPPVDIKSEMGPEPTEESTPVETLAETPSETPEETTDESQEETSDDSDEPKSGKQKVVPLAALSEARRQAREIRERAERLEKEHSEQIAALNEKLERLANPPPPEPTFDENPAENLRQRAERLEREQQEWRQAQEQTAKMQESQRQQQQALAYLNTEMEKAETQFTAKNPDYMDAVGYLRSVSEKNLRAQGVTDPTQIQRITYEQALGMAANAIQQGLNPAEVAYQFAKNYGYKAKVDATRQVKAMGEAQSRTQTLGNGSPDAPFSIAALAQMNDEDLAEAVANNWGKIKKLA